MSVKTSKTKRIDSEWHVFATNQIVMIFLQYVNTIFRSVLFGFLSLK